MENGDNIRKISPELQAIAMSELDEIPKRVPDDLKYIKEWLKTQPHIKARTDNHWLLIFLRGSKFSLEKTKQKIDTFYMNRTLIPEFFKNRDPFKSNIQRILKLGIFIPLVNTVKPTDPIVFFARNCVFDLTVDSFEDIYMVMFMFLEILMIENDNFVIAGHKMIVDMKDVNLAHYAIPATLIEKAFVVYQKTLPLRLKGYYYLNSTPIVEKCYKVLEPFMNDKFRNRVKQFNDKNVNELFAEIPQKLFPNEYGGEAGPIHELIDIWKTKIESYADYFKSEEKYCTDEAVRPGKPRTVFDEFAIEGSYRKMNID